MSRARGYFFRISEDSGGDSLWIRNGRKEDVEPGPAQNGGGGFKVSRSGRVDAGLRVLPPHRLVFGVRQMVTGEQPHRGQMLQPGKERGGLFQIARFHVEARNLNHSDFDRLAGFVEAQQVGENPRVVLPGERPVFLRVGRFEVVEKEVGHRQHAPERFPVHMAAGIDGAVDVLLFQSREQRRTEFALQQRLAAGDGDASSDRKSVV